MTLVRASWWMLAVGALDRNMAMVRDLGIFLSNMGVWWEYCLTLGAPGLTTSGKDATNGAGCY